VMSMWEAPRLLIEFMRALATGSLAGVV
jgi:hypothetical protein